jgi:uncharacterized protein YndB with AHSA1/START domain
MTKPDFVYVTYISTTPEKLWNALLDAKMTAQYWQHENVSDWKPGSRWEHRRATPERNLDLIGEVVEFSPPRKLVITWGFPSDDGHPEKHSRVTFDIEPVKGVVKLTVMHENLGAGENMLKGVSDGWPKVLASLKSLLETGNALPKLW